MMKFNISDLFLNKENTIKQAITCIDSAGYGITLVIDSEHSLLATITDGDIRRALLMGDTMESPLHLLIERKLSTNYPVPVTASQCSNSSQVLELMKLHRLRHIPLIDEAGRVVGLASMDDLLPAPKPALQVVVLAGDQHSRLHPLAVDLPKPMLPVGNRPLLEFTLNQLHQAGFDQVILTTHYKADAIIEHFGDGHELGVDITYHDESEPMGTAATLRNLEALNMPLLVINGDVLTQVNFNSMLAYHQEQQADITVAVHLHEFSIPYDVVETDNGRIVRIFERPALQKSVNAGIYLLNPDLLTLIPKDQSYDMPDLINHFVAEGRHVVSFPVHEYWRDIQVYDDYQQAVKDVRNGLFSDLSFTVASLEPGAPPPAGFVPLCVPALCGNEWVYIKECLDTNWVSSVGPFVDRFEESVANYVGRKYGVAASSGTAAIHTALLVAGVQPDDEVLLSDLTFIAPANAVRYINAWPVFIDIEPAYWQMDAQKLADFLKKECHWVGGELYNRKTGRHVSAIIPVHILGHPCDMNPILELAHQYNLIVIEDATESLGAKYKERMVGNLGDIACFSFNGNKIITTGGGGMIVTDNEQWAKRAKYLTTQAKDDPVEFVHGAVGYNYRLTNLQAAMGCAQMEQLPQFIQNKREIADRYRIGLENKPGLQIMSQADWAYSTYWMYTILINPDEYGMDRRQLLAYLGQNGIQVRPLWQPLHKSPVFNLQSFGLCETAEFIQDHAISLPCSVGLSPEEQDKVIEVVGKLK